MITPPDVAATFASYDPAIRDELLQLRRLVLDTAAETPGVGPVEEALRWGQPAYLTSESRSGSTIRLAPTGPGSRYDYAMYFICQTVLVDDFRKRFGDALTYDGQRALLFSLGQERPEDQPRECVASALTYRASRR